MQSEPFGACLYPSNPHYEHGVKNRGYHGSQGRLLVPGSTVNFSARARTGCHEPKGRCAWREHSHTGQSRARSWMMVWTKINSVLPSFSSPPNPPSGLETHAQTEMAGIPIERGDVVGYGNRDVIEPDHKDIGSRKRTNPGVPSAASRVSQRFSSEKRNPARS